MTRYTLTRIALILLLISSLALPSLADALKIVTSEWRPDKLFPQYQSAWEEGWDARDDTGQNVRYAQSMPAGGYIHVYFRNTGAAPLKIKDVLMDGVSLKDGVAYDKTDALFGVHPANVRFSTLPKPQIARLMTLGEPVWWKVEPETVEPGMFGDVVIRLRRSIPGGFDIKLLPESDTAATTLVNPPPAPQFTDISFTNGLSRVYLFSRHPFSKGAVPSKILLDGRDVTALCSKAGDPVSGISPIVLNLKTPLKPASYRCFQALYPDKTAATAVIGVWDNDEMAYGMWGYRPGDPKALLTDWAKHNINVHMGMYDGATQNYMLSDEGSAYMQSIGMRQMVNWFGNGRKRNLAYYFLQDEPDAQDFGIDHLELPDRLGGMAQGLIGKIHDLRFKDPDTPILLNLDNTYKPANWYTYAQLADIPCADPYFDVRIGGSTMATPEQVAFHIRPTCVYASSQILQSARAPKPMHIILLSASAQLPDGRRWRISPEGKAIEAFYALGAGAKGLSYWWFTPPDGCGGDDPASKDFYRGVGILGGQLRTAGPLIVRSTPADLPVKADDRLWVKTLVSGLDSVVVLIASNDFACDRAGTVIRPVKKTAVSVKLPAWLRASDAFEITSDGIRPANWRLAAGSAVMDLSAVESVRMIVLTNKPDLRAQLQALYDRKFAANVRALEAEAR